MLRLLGLRQPGQLPTQPQTPAAPTTVRHDPLALRLFANRVEEAVKENYSFPGKFDPNLRSIVRVTVSKDGSKENIVLAKSSGDERFDRLVCLAHINATRFPPIPEDVVLFHGNLN